MPQKVFSNVEAYRMLDGKEIVEDVTKISLPSIEHPTTELKGIAGMAGDIDMPNLGHINAMSYTIVHNNGLNGHLLSEPRRHEQELRVVRQVYNVAGVEIGHESVKCRFVGIPKKTDRDDVETGNPMGSTVEYACLKYEEERDGKIWICADIMSNKLVWNGVEYTLDINKYLD